MTTKTACNEDSCCDEDYCCEEGCACAAPSRRVPALVWFAAGAAVGGAVVLLWVNKDSQRVQAALTAARQAADSATAAVVAADLPGRARALPSAFSQFRRG